MTSRRVYMNMDKSRAARSPTIPTMLSITVQIRKVCLFSHFNDIGFWMFKEYYNVSIKQIFLIWTVMESIVGIVGLLAALLLSMFI